MFNRRNGHYRRGDAELVHLPRTPTVIAMVSDDPRVVLAPDRRMQMAGQIRNGSNDLVRSSYDT